jgi:hypothetical protein
MTNHTAETADYALKKVRTFQAVAIISTPLLAYAGDALSGEKTSGITRIGFLLLALAIFDIWSTFSWRRRRLQKAIHAVDLSPGDARSIKRWHQANLILLIGCESIALYGSLLQIWGGGTFRQALPFYICSLILLLVFTPRRLSIPIPASRSGDAS